MNTERRELALPEELRGPFQGEYDPAGEFRHPGSQLTSVLFYRSGGYSVVSAMGTEHFDRRWGAKPYTVIEVARGRHTTSFELDLPASGGASFFRAQVDVQWTVVDNFRVVEQRVVDVAEVLGPQIKQRLHKVSERFAVDDAQRANQAVNAELEAGAWRSLGAEEGLQTRVYVRIAVDAKAVEQADKYRDLRWEQREAEVRQETARLQERHQSELLALRMDFFRAMMEGGQGSQINYMLAQDPANAGAFLEALRQEGRGDRAGMLDRVMQWVSEGVIQSPDIERQVRRMLLSGGRTPDEAVPELPARVEVSRIPPDDAFRHDPDPGRDGDAGRGPAAESFDTDDWVPPRQQPGGGGPAEEPAARPSTAAREERRKKFEW
ncbi:hypothetical protein [Kitasatospora sp. NPDC088346]|uniref:hypothetical protein n=1 Tax=Kitasatospora sp. NPDC088346 TaxID=3364073 RepID=UPI00382481F1